ncbi:ferredoxin [Streptomyces sp. NPDC005349]|uniref:ferredoxin n=1 Tax=Streptomyces sp. NPDC005349 TaxID=3157037 RepID=UPI0033BEC8B9
MRIRFERDRCAGHAQCAAVAPDVYPMDDSGYCQLPPTSQLRPGLAREAREGAGACPERAITVIEDDPQGHTANGAP